MTTAARPDAPTGEDIVDRARAMRARLVERQAETEQLHLLPAGDPRGVPRRGLLPDARATALRRLRDGPADVLAGHHRGRAWLPVERLVPVPGIRPCAAGRLDLRCRGAGRAVRRRPLPRGRGRRARRVGASAPTTGGSSTAPTRTRRVPRTRPTTWARPSGRPAPTARRDAAVRRSAQRVDDARRLGRARSGSRAAARTASASRMRTSRRASCSRTRWLLDVGPDQRHARARGCTATRCTAGAG